MTIRFVKGRTRVETPQLKDLHLPATVRDRTVGRDAAGRFTSDNRAAIGRAAKALVRQSLGSDADPELVREALTLYRAIMRDLPSDGPSVRQLTASRCRHAVLATRYADLGAGRSEAVVEEWRRRATATFGRRVRGEAGGMPVEGVVEAVDAQGALVIRTARGPALVTSGELTWL